MLNKTILIGFVGKDPEMRRTRDGRPVANFSVATSEKWRDRETGDRRENTEWHSVVVFNDKLSEVVEKYVSKGSKVYIEGQNATRKWTDNNGVERYRTEVVVKAFRGAIVLLDKAERPAQSEEDYGSGDHREQSGSPAAATGGGGHQPRHDMDDEIPF